MNRVFSIAGFHVNRLFACAAPFEQLQQMNVLLKDANHLLGASLEFSEIIPRLHKFSTEIGYVSRQARFHANTVTRSLGQFPYRNWGIRLRQIVERVDPAFEVDFDLLTTDD